MKKLTQAVFNILPSRFTCAAIDEDGKAFAFPCNSNELRICRLSPGNSEHVFEEGNYSYIGDGYDPKDWQNSAIDREVNRGAPRFLEVLQMSEADADEKGYQLYPVAG